jgi:hypothetical protein
MYSNPLFMRVALSMVIFGPIFQLGCASAFSAVASSLILALDHPRKGPPEAVRMIFSTGLLSFPCKHCHMAECSLSMGVMRTPLSRALAIIRPPAVTRLSLLARAMFFPAAIAARVGAKPALPVRALTTTVALLSAAQATRPESPVKTSTRCALKPLRPSQRSISDNVSAAGPSGTHTISGENSATHFASAGMLP